MVSLSMEDGWFEQVVFVGLSRVDGRSGQRRWSICAGRMVDLSREDGQFVQVGLST